MSTPVAAFRGVTLRPIAGDAGESEVKDAGHYFCPVCGWLGLSARAVFPYDSFEICSCCGTEFGLDVSEDDDIEDVREEWLEGGAVWFSDEGRPADWSPERAIAQVRAYDERKRRAGRSHAASE